jgi:hypothetical protein
MATAMLAAMGLQAAGGTCSGKLLHLYMPMGEESGGSQTMPADRRSHLIVPNRQLTLVEPRHTSREAQVAVVQRRSEPVRSHDAGCSGTYLYTPARNHTPNLVNEEGHRRGLRDRQLTTRNRSRSRTRWTPP